MTQISLDRAWGRGTFAIVRSSATVLVWASSLLYAENDGTQASRAQQEHPLVRGMKQALASSPELQLAQHEAAAAREEPKIARSEFLPHVSLEASRSVKNFQGDQGQGRGYANYDYIPGGESVVVSQSVYSGGRSVATWRRGKANAQAGQFREASTTQKVLDDVAKAYISLWKSFQLVELFRAEEDRKKKFLESTQTRQNLGVSSKMDVARAEAQLASMRASRTQAEASLAASRFEYERLTGEQPDKLLDPIVLADLPSDVDTAISQALAHNPQLSEVEAKRQASKAEVDMALAEFMPKFDIEARLSHQKSDVTDGTSTSYSHEQQIMGRLSLPLYQGGRDAASTNRAQAHEHGAAENVRKTRQELETSVRQVFYTLLSQKNQKRYLGDQVASTEKIADGVRTEYKFGTRSVFDVFDAEKDVVNARQSLIETDAKMYESSYQILKMLGFLMPSRLNLS